MSYVSLYRKYRSQTFGDVVGQDHVVKTIGNAIKAGRIGQGYLFCGSRGTGKTTVARLIAKALNCQSSDKPTVTPCNTCDACVAIASGNAVDVIEMDAASNRGVDDVDALRDGVKYPPMSLRYKVYIIDEAHQLSAQAKDAFLKTLEEPPPHAVFILATTESHKIPITIRSRCQQFDFRRGSVEEIISRLKFVCDAEQSVIDENALDMIARSASGSYRDSLSLLEQVLLYQDGQVTAKDVAAVLGTVDEDLLFEMSSVLASNDTAAAFALADKMMREGKDVRELLKSAANHFRDILAAKVGANVPGAYKDKLAEHASYYTRARLVAVIEDLAAAEKDLRWNEQHRLALEMTLVRMMQSGAQNDAPFQNEEAVAVPPVRIEKPEVASTPTQPESVESSSPAVEEVPSVTSSTADDHAPVEEEDEIAEDIAAGPVMEEPGEISESEIRPDISTPVAPQAQKPEPQGPITEEAPSFDMGASEVSIHSDDGLADVKGTEEAAPEQANGGVSLHKIKDNWNKIVLHIQKVMKLPNVAACAGYAEPADMEDGVLTLLFEPKWEFHRLTVERDNDKISQAIGDILGDRPRVVTRKQQKEKLEVPEGQLLDNHQEEDVDSAPKQHPLLDQALIAFPQATLIEDEKDTQENIWEDQ